MERTMRILANIIILAVLLVMVGYLAKFTIVDDIKLFSVDSQLVFPVLVGSTILILFAINLTKELKARKAAKASAGTLDEKKDENLGKQLAPVALFAVGTLVYILLLKYLHFLVGTFAFMVLGMFLLNETAQKLGKRVLFAGLAGLITVPALYLVFNVVFNVQLP
jgi:hypothetical protein